MLQIRPSASFSRRPMTMSRPLPDSARHWFWDTSLGADPTVLGETLMVNGRATIVGVAPKDFNGTTYGLRPASTRRSRWHR
jgi:hypothetical protein